jgi:hypothetical protein
MAHHVDPLGAEVWTRLEVKQTSHKLIGRVGPI